MPVPHAKVVQDPEKPVEVAVLAQAIVDISVAVKRLSASGLNRRAIVVLLHDSSNVSMRDIGYVLNALESLATQYTTPKNKVPK